MTYFLASYVIFFIGNLVLSNLELRHGPMSDFQLVLMLLSGTVGVEIDEISLSIPCPRNDSTGQLRVTQFPLPHGWHCSHLSHKFSSEGPECT